MLTVTNLSIQVLKQLRLVGHSLRKLGLVVIVYLECDFVFVHLTANTDRESSFLELAGSSSGVQLDTTTQGEHALGTRITNKGNTSFLSA